VHVVGVIIRFYHDARSPERQIHTTLLIITPRMGEPGRYLDDANIKQLLLRREEEAQPSAQCCVMRKKRILLFKAYFRRQTVARSRQN